MLEITLKKSLIGSKKNQLATAKALGLKKINGTVTKKDNDATRGMINVLANLIEVKEVK